jgi:protein involved in polysaccharide export with SLBB domain
LETSFTMKLITSILIALMLGGCAKIDLATEIPVTAYVYQIGPGDKLRISVFDEPQLTGEYAVTGAGVVAFPLIGDINAASQTVTEFRDQLRDKLGSKYIRDPKVTIEVLNFRPVYILGEVTRPGEFPYQERMSVYGLVAKSGGFTYRANQTFVYIRHEQDAEEKAIKLTSSTAVRPGDTVRVPDRIF